MDVPAEFVQEVAAFPAALLQLVEAELREGNTIVSMEHGFPATMNGASIRLARPVHTERRRSSGDLHFCERNNAHHAGEFTTAERYFFVLEPPLPPAPPPDMDAIREEFNARERAENADRFKQMY